MLIISQNPSLHPHAFFVSPIISCPIADPKIPLPSIIPATVVKALGLFYKAFYFPRSAAIEALIKLHKPLIKNPMKNIKANNP